VIIFVRSRSGRAPAPADAVITALPHSVTGSDGIAYGFDHLGAHPVSTS